MAEPEGDGPRRDWWIALGMTVSATSAAVSSFAGLRGLAVVAGWPVLLAPLLPLTVDACAMTATRVWLADSTRSVRARHFARTNAVGAILLSLCGNAVYHLIVVHLVVASWVVVVAVGAVPALVLGLVSHLAVLRCQVDPVSDPVQLEAGPDGRPVAGSAAPIRTEGELLAAARAADQTYRTAHAGRSITRDALRVGGARASVLLKQLRQERGADP